MTLNTPGFEETQTIKSVRIEISVRMEKSAIGDVIIVGPARATTATRELRKLERENKYQSQFVGQFYDQYDTSLFVF